MNPNVYKNQQLRAISRKKELVEMLGGKCSVWGYNKNYAALEFHHKDPDEKSFPLDGRHLSNTAMETIIDEVKKCVLLCSNCHKEIHYPGLNSDKIDSLVTKNKSLFEDKTKKSVCPVCGEKFNAEKGKIYCSAECRKKSKSYPEKSEVLAKYEELKSQQKVAEYYGLTRKIIRGILKG